MSKEELAERLGRLLKRDARVLAVFLAGSLVQGGADDYSDLDLVLVAEEEHHDSLAALCRGYLQQCQPLVYWKRSASTRCELQAITAQWLRCDVSILSPAAIRGRARESLAVIWDRAHIADSLAPAGAPDGDAPQRVRDAIDGFIRSLGLLPVLLGRGEYVLGMSHAARLRDQLLTVLLEADGAPGRGRELRLDPLLSPESRAVLTQLPAVEPRRESLIAAYQACARAFLPRAQALAAELGADWPESFVTATRRLWREELDLDWAEGGFLPESGQN